jgi:hypothetical protein
MTGFDVFNGDAGAPCRGFPKGGGRGTGRDNARICGELDPDQAPASRARAE